jgi:hypothetical protein
LKKRKGKKEENRSRGVFRDNTLIAGKDERKFIASNFSRQYVLVLWVTQAEGETERWEVNNVSDGSRQFGCVAGERVRLLG